MMARDESHNDSCLRVQDQDISQKISEMNLDGSPHTGAVGPLLVLADNLQSKCL